MNDRLTQYSHGAGCGCKISPQVLREILGDLHSGVGEQFLNLVVGNDSQDDAAVFDIGGGRGIISTTDFFMPIVDDAYDFGWIASANALSDVYAMGGTPLMAIAILGWPIKTLSPKIASKVLAGAKAVCSEAGIPLAGGHSIDTQEPIFGLAVTGEVDLAQMKRNNTATAGCSLFLTKPLGVGILTTAEKKGVLHKEHIGLAAEQMKRLNKAGRVFARLDYIKAMTDVTGFGLTGHLLEMCAGNNLSAEINYAHIPVLPGVNEYLKNGVFPGGTERNLLSYGSALKCEDILLRHLLADPQTSGGLLVAVDAQSGNEFRSVLKENNLSAWKIGQLKKGDPSTIRVVVE